MLLTPAHQRWAADLRWFFLESDGEMGLRSNFGAVVAGLEGGGHTARVNHDVADRVMAAAERARHIRRTMEAEAVPVWAQVVLRVAFRREDGELALMGALTSAVREHRRSRTKRSIEEWLAKTRDSKSPERRLLYAQLRAEVTSLAEEALDLYAQAVREAGSGWDERHGA